MDGSTFFVVFYHPLRGPEGELAVAHDTNPVLENIMKTRLKEKLVIGMLAFAMLGMASCGKDEDKVTTSPDTNSMELLSYMPPKKIKQVHDDDGYTETFFWDGNLLVGRELVHEGEGFARYIEKYVYSNGRLDTVYKLELPYGYYEKMFYEGGRLVKIKQGDAYFDDGFFVIKNSQEYEKELVYKEGFVSEVRIRSEGFIGFRKYEWEDGNVVKVISSSGCIDSMKYDSNPSPFPVVGTPIYDVGQSWCKNNPIKSICTCENVDYDITYTYDSDGMPVSSVWVSSNGRFVNRLTYTYYE